MKITGLWDHKLKIRNQLSVTWMGIPSFGKMHIPSCDFSARISTEHYLEFAKKIQMARKSLVLDIQLNELEEFISAINPKGIMLCRAANEDIQTGLIKRIGKW